MVETDSYLRRAMGLPTETERSVVVETLAARPEAGSVIPETGGLQKMRFGLEGRGKRGGARVIYLFLDWETPLLLLLAYAKNEPDDMTPQQKASLSKIVMDLKRRQRR